MLDVLNFVKGAVGKKDLVPALTHFHIANGRISGFNGKISISAPIALDIDCCPKAEPFVRAIEACAETAQLHLTPTGKLSIRSGKFRAHVDTVGSEAFPEVQPEGQFIEVDGKLLPILRTLYDFIGEDASRPWATGIMFNGTSAFATNNVIVAEHWLGYHFPFKVVVPRYTIKEMLRIGEEPIRIQLTALNATFHYEGNRWLRTQLVSNEWPDVQTMLDIDAAGESEAIPDGFWEALKTISPFLDEASRVYLDGSTIRTSLDDGASMEIEGAGLIGLYNHKMLSLLAGVAQRANWQAYPSRVGWYGDCIRGLIIGMRP